MTVKPPNLMEDAVKSHKASHEYPQKAKGMSFFAFLLSVFIYVAIFYVFNLSPSTLFNTTKFWFFISNTLILIIAADYGAFSSSEEKQDLREEFMMYSHDKTVSPMVPEYPEDVKESTVKQEVDDWKEKKVIHVGKERALPKPSRREALQEKRQVDAPQADKSRPRTYRRSKSERTKRVVIDESKNIMRGSETEKLEPNAEENEYSAMSDEELNRRFEEFIQRFNRQIRLQGTSNSGHI